MTLQHALMEKDSMTTVHEKKLFITLFGYLIDESFKTKMDNNENIDEIFNELCNELVKKSS